MKISRKADLMTITSIGGMTGLHTHLFVLIDCLEYSAVLSYNCVDKEPTQGRDDFFTAQKLAV